MNRYLSFCTLLIVLIAGCMPVAEFESVSSGPRATIIWSAPELTDLSGHKVSLSAFISNDKGQCSINDFTGSILLRPEKKTASYFIAAQERLYVSVEYAEMPTFLGVAPSRTMHAFFSFMPEVDQVYEFTFSKGSAQDRFVINTKSLQGDVSLQSWSVCQNPDDQKSYNIGNSVVGTSVR